MRFYIILSRQNFNIFFCTFIENRERKTHLLNRCHLNIFQDEASIQIEYIRFMKVCLNQMDKVNLRKHICAFVTFAGCITITVLLLVKCRIKTDIDDEENLIIQVPSPVYLQTTTVAGRYSLFVYSPHVCISLF